ncbi:MAG: GNAT family protein [Rhodoferax sp.]|nr:GNAT family protein [Rhodoferax sp.]MDP3653414.1 GNAT family protein [Rhodoferax sp.]
MTTVQQITTERLTLRAFEASDVHAVYDIFSDDRVTEFYDCDTFSRLEQAKEWLASRTPGDVKHDGQGATWAICLTAAPGVVIGSCGFHTINRDFYSIAIGYDLHPAHWGRGYAFEANAAMLGFCFANDVPFHVNRVAATTDLDSQRSMNLLRKLGFSEEGVLRQYGYWKGKFNDVRMFSLLREDWSKKTAPSKADRLGPRGHFPSPYTTEKLP